AAAICIVIGVVALWALGFPPSEVISAVAHKVLWHPDPSLRFIAWVNILQYSTPILLTGLAVTVAFRASVWNIGAQGHYLAGAIVRAHELLTARQVPQIGPRSLPPRCVAAWGTATVVWCVLGRSTFGLGVREVGGNPIADRFAGGSVARVSFAPHGVSRDRAG